MYSLVSMLLPIYPFQDIFGIWRSVTFFQPYLWDIFEILNIVKIQIILTPYKPPFCMELYVLWIKVMYMRKHENILAIK